MASATLPNCRDARAPTRQKRFDLAKKMREDDSRLQCLTPHSQECAGFLSPHMEDEDDQENEKEDEREDGKHRVESRRSSSNTQHERMDGMK